MVSSQPSHKTVLPVTGGKRGVGRSVLGFFIMPALSNLSTGRVLYSFFDEWTSHKKSLFLSEKATGPVV